MRLAEALSIIHPPQSTTTLMGSVLAGDSGAADNSQATADVTVEQAEAKLASVTESQNQATSDATWWGWDSQRAYWSCVVNLLKAAAITGPDEMPPVLPPVSLVRGGMLMDMNFEMEEWGKAVLARAEETKAGAA